MLFVREKEVKEKLALAKLLQEFSVIAVYAPPPPPGQPTEWLFMQRCDLVAKADSLLCIRYLL